MRYRGSAAIIAVCVLAGCASPPASWNRATLLGIVSATDGTPIVGALITVNGGPSARSDIHGRVAVANVSRGEIALSAARRGYEPLEARLTFTDRTQVLHLVLRSATDMLTEAERQLVSGDHAGVRRLATRAAAVAPDDPVVRFHASVLLVRAGDPDTATGLLEGFAPGDEAPEPVRALRDIAAGKEEVQ